MQRKVFFGIGAEFQGGPPDKMDVVALLYNGQKADPANAFTIDTLATPISKKAAGWSSIACDDRGWDYNRDKIVVNPKAALPPGAPVTTVGDPNTDAEKTGALYLASDTFRANRTKILADPKAVWPPVGYAEYQLTTVAYSDDTTSNPVMAGMRFIGFKAHVLEQRGTLVKVLLFWNANNEWRGPVWLDLANPEDCDGSRGNAQDPNDPLLQYTFAGDGVVQGAIYIRMERYSRLINQQTLPRGPKLPIGHGF
ncbi:MAG: hypothetical protein JNK64_27120 [Myxococcales bacterium]|nr:hypothetical protein [Myxococcales bacterium]